MHAGRALTIPEIHTTPIPPEILEEIETFEEEAQRFQAGETPAEIFKPFRLQYGIYGQRQPDVQMVRIKIPFGGLTANQLRRIAELAETYATGVGHVTTRQDIQLHFVSLRHVGTIMRKLAEVGLTTREACANTVRNVTACHLAGVCPGEVFDVTPYAKTVAYHLLRNPLNQSLPRKFKIAFSGCHHDCALTPIHDIGLLATKRDDGTMGFRMVVGGGLGSTPRIAHLLREFVPMEELIPSIEAVIKVFDNLGNRKNRNKARMKFVIDKLGFPEFTRRWEEAYHALQAASGQRPTPTFLSHPDPAPLIMPVKPSRSGHGTHEQSQASAQTNGRGAEFERWRTTNTVAQRQPGFLAAVIKLPTGDITADQMLAVADMAETYSNGNIRTTIHQNLVLRWVPEARIEELYSELATHGLGQPGAEHAEDIVACPGTDTCGLGITSSKGLARALAEIFPPGQTADDLNGVSVHISGCHNSCAQHHIATIGLHGVGKRQGDHVAPVYELHLGGQINGSTKIGQMILKLPAKAVPRAIAHLLDLYRRSRHPGETLPAFIDRLGKAKLKEELIPYSILPAYEQDASYYFDWEADEEFTVEDLGPGECAGGALEMIDNRILEAEQELYQAKVLAEKHQYAFAVNKAYRAVVAAAKALLVTEGVDPNTDAETLAELDRFMAAHADLLPETYRTLRAQVSDLGPKEATQEFVHAKLAFARGFVEACRLATEQLTKDLKLGEAASCVAASASSTEPPSVQAAHQPPAEVLDLRGVMCPLNYVKTKLKLETMNHGDRLEVWLDAGDPIKNVPVSLRNDGHTVLTQEPLDAQALHFKVLVEKVEG
ncbi:MAG: HEPN domain-containing protein [Nitrospirae bacterium]|nr:MAG: HEPN domain-containing protein [Nitrospirota bacterium]